MQTAEGTTNDPEMLAAVESGASLDGDSVCGVFRFELSIDLMAAAMPGGMFRLVA